MSTSKPITIGEREFRARRVTGRDLRARMEVDDALADAGDEASALAVELDQLAGALAALAREEHFDSSRRDELLGRRRSLRRELSEADARVYELRLEAIAGQLEPTPEPEYLREHLPEDDVTALIGEINSARPTRERPSALPATPS